MAKPTYNFFLSFWNVLFSVHLLPQFKYSMPWPYLPPLKRQEPINSFIFYIHLHKKTKAEKPIYKREREREMKYLNVPSGQGRRACWGQVCQHVSGWGQGQWHIEGWNSYFSILPSPALSFAVAESLIAEDPIYFIEI